MKSLKITCAVLTMILTQILAIAPVHSDEKGSESGGGGNGSKRAETYSDEIYEAINAQRIFQLQTFRGLGMKADQETQEGRSYPWHKIYNEMRNYPQASQFISNLEYQPQQKPCIAFGEESDSSAIFPNKVCISISRLEAHDYAPEDLLSRITALVTHEIAHLMGISKDRHEEIWSLQNEVENTVGRKSAWGLISKYVQLHNNMNAALLWRGVELNLNSKDLTAICTSVSLADFIYSERSVMHTVLSDYLIVENPLGVRAEAYLIELQYRMMNILITGCGMKMTKPFNVIEELFAKNETITVFDVQFAIQNAFLKINKNDYLKNDCGPNGFICKEQMGITLRRIRKGDLVNIKMELQLARIAYDNYYKLVLPLAKLAEKIQENPIQEAN